MPLKFNSLTVQADNRAVLPRQYEYFWLGCPILQGENKLHSCFSRENAKSPLLQTDSSGTAVPFKRGKRFLTKYFPFFPYIFRDFLIGIEGRWPLKRRYNTPQKSSKEFSPFLGFHSFSRHNQVKGRAP